MRNMAAGEGTQSGAQRRVAESDRWGGGGPGGQRTTPVDEVGSGCYRKREAIQRHVLLMGVRKKGGGNKATQKAAKTGGAGGAVISCNH